ncbi:MAG TPA: alpha/beta fold hydrolase [Micromonosporaceae bacterium]|jgi:hypothetical protein
MTTWIAPTTGGTVLAREAPDGTFLVDRPDTGRFRTAEAVAVTDGVPHVDGTALRPVAVLPPGLASMTGWYEGGGRTILLTQFPESYFGEPMILLGEGLIVRRAYPLSASDLITEDGRAVTLTAEGLTVPDGDGAATLRRTPRLREQQVTFSTGDVTLAGTVIVPDGAGPHPAAVVVHGAAGGQRDFYRLLVSPLLDAGVAVLIYDKAGHGDSEGTPPSIFDQADAAQAALDLLATLPGIDAGRRGLAGFSNGMWSVPMVAARYPEVAFIAGIGAPGVSMGESEVHRRTKVLRDAGVGPQTVAAVGDAWRCIFTIVGAGTADDDVTARLAASLKTIEAADDTDRYQVPDYVRENPMLSPFPPPLPMAELVAMLVAENDPEVGYDPAADYARIRCPILLQYGGRDTSVPVQASTDQVRSAAPHATIQVYPALEHMLNEVPTDVTGLDPEAVMYGFHRFRFGPTVGSDLTTWLRTTVF